MVSPPDDIGSLDDGELSVQRYPFDDVQGLYAIGKDICTAEFVVASTDYDSLKYQSEAIFDHRNELLARYDAAISLLQEFMDYQISDYDRRADLASAYCDIRRRARRFLKTTAQQRGTAK